MRNFLTFLVFMMILIRPSMAQNHLLSRINATEDKDRVILSWTIKRNHSCIGIGILRSNNGVDYELIGEIKGVCGSTVEDQHYTFVDDAPVENKVNYYVLELGFEGRTSPPLKVRFIDFSERTSKVTPNPTKGYARIQFFNPNNEDHTINLYDTYGQYIISHKTNGNSFEFDFDPFIRESKLINTISIAQTYIYTILSDSGKNVSTGKIVVNR